jgi:MoaA/NifB/PqqE/SkfB family radical SAM enzyme
MNNFWNFDELSQLHIELTNNCNAACPMCQRFLYGSKLIRPDLEISQISLDQFKKWIPSDVLNKINLIMFCGTQGDPCVARDFYEICEYIHNNSKNTAIRVHTNGGMKTPEWWYKLGKLFSLHIDNPTKYWQMTFSIDGLEDTNHIYRRNVVWTKLIENVKSFIEGNGRNKYTAWDYLIFEHNEHQLDDAKKLSNELGFEFFAPKRALGVDNGKQLTGMPVLDNTGKLEYWIRAPKSPQNRNLANPIKEESYDTLSEFNLEDYKEWKKKKLKIKDFFITDNNQLKSIDTKSECVIKCKSNVVYPKGKEVFIDSFGYVSPCCYIGTHVNNLSHDLRIAQVHTEIDKRGKENFNLDKYSLKEILDGDHLNAIYAESWDKPNYSDGRIAMCEETCGTNSKIDRINSHEDNPREKLLRFVKKS